MIPSVFTSTETRLSCVLSHGVTLNGAQHRPGATRHASHHDDGAYCDLSIRIEEHIKVRILPTLSISPFIFTSQPKAFPVPHHHHQLIHPDRARIRHDDADQHPACSRSRDPPFLRLRRFALPACRLCSRWQTRGRLLPRRNPGNSCLWGSQNRKHTSPPMGSIFFFVFHFGDERCYFNWMERFADVILSQLTCSNAGVWVVSKVCAAGKHCDKCSCVS